MTEEDPQQEHQGHDQNASTVVGHRNNDGDDDDGDEDDQHQKKSDTTVVPLVDLDDNRPFEWLTSPESLQSLIDEHVVFFGNSSCSEDNVNDNTTDDKKSNGRSVLHIGCGSSLWGEYLLRNQLHEKQQQRQDSHQHCNRWEKVVNVDRDAVIMNQMEQRWRNICSSYKSQQQRHQQHNGSNTKVNDGDHSSTSSILQQDMMEFVTLDFTTAKLPFEDGYFDVVLDKSTLDCTLCSDVSTAHMLVEIYRTLSHQGGTYVIISFHEIELLLPLLRDLPGSQWTVETTTMSRQIERHEVNGNTTISITSPAETATASSTTTVSDSTSDNQKPLNVLIIRKTKNKNAETENDHGTKEYKLDYDEVCHHIHETNNRWFQVHNPLLTPERIDDIRQAFQSQQQHQNNDKDEEELALLSLDDAYEVLFTDAEREHLTVEHFLEDWDAFCDSEEKEQHENRQCTAGSGSSSVGRRRDKVSFDQAIKFLEFSQ